MSETKKKRNMVRCPICGSPVVIKTSWTQFNPGRRFYCCSKRGSNHGIIDWYDPPMCNRAVQIIPGLLRNMNESQAIVAENRGTIRRLKMMLVFSWVFVLILYVFK